MVTSAGRDTIEAAEEGLIGNGASVGKTTMVGWGIIAVTIETSEDMG